VVLTDLTQRVIIGKQLKKYTGDGPYTIEALSASTDFVASNKDAPNLGTYASDVWLKFSVTNKSKHNDFLLEIAYPLLDEIELFALDTDGRYRSVLLGEHNAFSERKYHVPNYVFDLNVPQQATRTFFLRVNSIEQIILPVYIHKRWYFSRYTNLDHLISGIYIGIVFIMVIYNLFLFFSVREKGYLYYVLYIAFAGITQMGIKGYSFQYLWPNWPEFASKGPIISGALSGIAALLFADTFLKIKNNAPGFRRLFRTFIALFVFSLLLVVFDINQLGFLSMQMVTGVASIMVLYVSYKVMMNGYRPALYFVLGWTILLMGSVIFLLKDYGILLYSGFTSYSVQAASVIEMALLSFGLAYSINILKKEKEQSQARALSISQENEKLIREQNIVLEQRVAERTKALRKSNQSLQETLTHLKEAQGQLVEAEKMASLGQLTAGVAHEINNPINFVTSNVAPLRRDIGMLWEALAAIEDIAFSTELTIEEKIQKINAYKEAQDLDYLKTEIDFLLKGMHEGAHRTAEIVRSLRIFSRTDGDSLKYADINEGLESTLVILNSLIREETRVVRQYGQLPEIACYPGKLNQVFLNIITNALYAIHKKFNGKPGGVLGIKTDVDADNVYISIKDNGIGMPADIRDRIFEPFFTTKEVGEGTGLGLSIVYNTIKKHQGEIKIESEVGEGTEFMLSIPLNLQAVD